MNKKNLKEIPANIAVDPKGKMINRKEAIKKTGYVAISVATMMVLLSSPAKANVSSPAPIAPW